MTLYGIIASRSFSRLRTSCILMPVTPISSIITLKKAYLRQRRLLYGIERQNSQALIRFRTNQSRSRGLERSHL